MRELFTQGKIDDGSFSLCSQDPLPLLKCVYFTVQFFCLLICLHSISKIAMKRGKWLEGKNVDLIFILFQD